MRWKAAALAVLRTVEKNGKEAKFAETVHESEDKFLGGSNGCASQSNHTASPHGFGLLYRPLEPILYM